MAVGPTVKKIREVYRGKIRLVIKNYPYIYRDYSHLAAEASLDARDQGKYWEMHDLLLERSPKLDRESLLSYAKELGLDMKKFTVRQGKPGAFSGCNSRPGKGNEPPHRESSLGLMKVTT